MTYQLHHGNCIEIMPLIERESVDAIVTDPPYGLGFMGKDWDHGVPGEHFWREAYRCAKPGAYLLAFGGTRTYHRLTVAIEDAGWEIRDCVMWVYGSGFPKSHNVSIAIDKEAGAVREVVGKHPAPRRNVNATAALGGSFQVAPDITAPATPEARQWEGWGTALKPAWEPIIVARKPLSGTVAENVQRYGTGAMNIDACRVETEPEGRPALVGLAIGYGAQGHSKAIGTTSQGRWPANVIHDGSAEVVAGFPQTVSHGGGQSSYGGMFGNGKPAAQTFHDTGSAARFFYCAKASKQDRDGGLEGFELRDASIGDQRPSGSMSQRIHSDEGRPDTLARNYHPTVKPTALMRYLCRLVTPPHGVILDPFMGSGSTGKAAMLEGFNFIGIDTEIEYVEIAARRIEHACEKVGIVIEQPMEFDTQRDRADVTKQMLLL